MPSSNGYLAISLAVAALGVCYGLWCNIYCTTRKKSKKNHRNHDWTSSVAHLKTVKTNLELEVMQLQEVYASLENKIESAGRVLEEDRDSKDKSSLKASQLQISSVSEVEVKECLDPGQIAHSTLSVSSQPLHTSFPKDSAMDDELKQDHPSENWLDVQEKRFQTSVGVAESVDLEPVILHIEPFEGIHISEENQDGTFLLEHKQQLFEESTSIKDQVTKNKGRQTKHLQESKEHESEKSLLCNEIQELQLIKAQLEDQVRHLKGKCNSMRSSSLRSEITVDFARESNTLRSRRKKSLPQNTAIRNSHNDHESLHERLKHIRARTLGRNMSELSDSLQTSESVRKVPLEGLSPFFFKQNSSENLGMVKEEEPRADADYKLSNEVGSNPTLEISIQKNTNQSNSGDLLEWNVSPMFLT